MALFGDENCRIEKTCRLLALSSGDPGSSHTPCLRPSLAVLRIRCQYQSVTPRPQRGLVRLRPQDSQVQNNVETPPPRDLVEIAPQVLQENHGSGHTAWPCRARDTSSCANHQNIGVNKETKTRRRKIKDGLGIGRGSTRGSAHPAPCTCARQRG
jgi:hypothetical protein